MINADNITQFDLNTGAAIQPDTGESQGTEEPKKDEYFTIPLGRRNIRIRKWKVKDRNTLKKSLQITDPDKQTENTLKILVWNCIEGKIPLNKDELEYVFAQIRLHSIGDKVTFKYTCSNPECSKLNTKSVKISDIWRPKFSELQNIGDIEIQEVQNADYYNKKMAEYNYGSLYDLILHIKSIGGKQYKENEIIEYFENMDTLDADKILDAWEKMAFSLDRDNTLICEKCGNENVFEFDEIPELIPPIWFKR